MASYSRAFAQIRQSIQQHLPRAPAETARIITCFETIADQLMSWQKQLNAIRRPPHSQTLEEMGQACEQFSTLLDELDLWLEESVNQQWIDLKNEIAKLQITYRSLPVRSALTTYIQRLKNIEITGEALTPTQQQELETIRFQAADGLTDLGKALRRAVANTRRR